MLSRTVTLITILMLLIILTSSTEPTIRSEMTGCYMTYTLIVIKATNDGIQLSSRSYDRTMSTMQSPFISMPLKWLVQMPEVWEGI